MIDTTDQQRTSLNSREATALKMCDDLVEHFQRKSKSNKSNFQFYKYASILLASLVTIAASLELFYGPVIPKVIVPILGAITTFATTFLSVSKTQRIWADSRTTAQRLQKEKFLYTQRASIYEEANDEKRLAVFSKNIMDVWSDGHEKWELTISES